MLLKEIVGDNDDFPPAQQHWASPIQNPPSNRQTCSFETVLRASVKKKSTSTHKITMTLMMVFIRLVQVVFQTALVFAMAVLYFVLFFMGGYGRGDEVYLLLKSYSSFFYSCAIVSVGLTVLLSLLDVGYWRGPFKYVGYLMFLITGMAYMLTVLSFTADFPASPMCLYLFLCPLAIYLLQKTPMYNKQPVHIFVFHLAVAQGIVGLVSLGVWLYWLIAYDMWWNTATKLDFYFRLECISSPVPTVNVTQFIQQVDSTHVCNAALVEWISPLILGIFCLLLSVSMLFLVRAESRHQKHKRQMDMKTQAFVVLLSLVILGMWASAGVAGANVQLSSIVFAFCFLFLVLGSSAMFLMSGRDGVYKNLMSVPLAKRVLESASSDWLRSLLMLGVIPISLVVLPFSRLRQLGRKYLPFTKPLVDDRERLLYFSLETTRLLHNSSKWNWTSILTKMIWWGVAFFSLSVICARVLNVLFSALGEAIDQAGLTFGPVVGVFIVVGFLLFQFPPTPGMPIFYAAAVILTKSAMQEGYTLWEGWGIATVVSILLKYSSLVSGQLLGQIWGKYSTSIRKTVGINSYEMRAIRLILMKKGLNFRKSAMLCGSPDWPAAVICGILNTSYVQNIIHQFPVIIIVLPITLAGSLTLMGSSNAVYSSAATISLSIAVLCQGLSMMIAMHYIEDTVQYHKQELDEFPQDEKVAELEEQGKAVAAHRVRVSQWKVLPMYIKFVLITGVLAESFSLYLFLLFSANCFVAFDVTDSIANKLDGNAINLVQPLGWIGIGAFAYGCVVLVVLGRWISCQRVQQHQVEDIVPQEEGVTALSSKQKTETEDEAIYSSHRYESCFGVCKREY